MSMSLTAPVPVSVSVSKYVSVSMSVSASRFWCVCDLIYAKTLVCEIGWRRVMGRGWRGGELCVRVCMCVCVCTSNRCTMMLVR